MNGVLSKGKSALLPIFNSLLYSSSDKAILLAKTFLGTLILMNPLPVLSFKTNVKLHKVSITPKLVKRVITKLDLPKACGPDSIQVVVLKNFEPFETLKFSYILAELFNMYEGILFSRLLKGLIGDLCN